MKKVLIIFTLSLIAVLSTANINAYADECTARIIHDGTMIKGNKLYSKWIIGHNPWRWATVSFRYRIEYVDESNEERYIDGFFSQLITGKEDNYKEIKNTRHHPARIILTKYSDLNCDRF